VDLNSKQAKDVQGNGNVTFKEAINIISIRYVMTKEILFELTTNVHMNKKNIFNIMCKKLSKRRANINPTTQQGCMTSAKL